MTMLRGLVAVLLCLAAALSPAAARDMVRIGLSIEPPALDPSSGAASATDEVVYPTIFEGLVHLGADGSILPLLATRWTVSPDGRDYVFDLRHGVRFHDGRPFTAADVVFSLSRAIAPGSTNAQAEALSVIADVTALAPDRVRITLKVRDADFLRLLTYADAVMVSPVSAGRLATAPIGTGPFRFGDWRRGDTVTLLRNAGYWGAKPHLARVRFRLIPDPAAAFAAMRAGDVDIFADYPAPETIDQLRADPRLAVTIGQTEGEVILAYNHRAGPLAKVAVRRAIAHALDARAIVDGAMYGYGTPIGSHFPPQSPDYVDLAGRYRHDPALARRMLADAGYPNGFAVTLSLPPMSYARRSGEIVAAQLGQAGVRVTIRTLEWAAWLDEVLKRHQFDMTIVDHAEPFDYDIYGRTDYYFGYDSPAFRSLLARLKATADPAARHALLGDVQRLLSDDAANGFLFQFPRLGVQDQGLRDVWANTPNQALDLVTARFDGVADGDSAARADATGGRWLGVVVAVATLAAAVALLGPMRALGRLAALAGTVLAATIVVFALLQVAPGDPAAFMMGLNASPRAIAALHAELGLGGPAPARYLRWLTGMAQGDFGTSYTYRVPVAGLIADRLALSLPLALLATALSVVVGVPAGVLAARRPGSAMDRAIGWLARIGIALPGFWLAMLLVLLFSVRLGWAAAGGFPGWSAGIGPALAALAMPIVALGLPQAAVLARIARASLAAAIDHDFVRTARATGMGRDAAILRHALPNALGPVLTVLGLQLPFLLAGSAIVETMFYLPGLGRLVIQAIQQRDLIVVQSSVIVLVALTVAASFLVDLAYAAIDPRLREAGR